MARSETYYYGQGKVFLAERDPVTGEPGVYRWIGDCDSLSLALEVESFDHKESYTGQRNSVRRLYTGKEGTISSTWYERSPENVALVVYGQSVSVAAGTVTGEALPVDITAGAHVALAHQNVSKVVIGDLVEGTDYTLFADVGSIEFLTTPDTEDAALTVNYSHGAYRQLQPRRVGQYVDVYGEFQMKSPCAMKGSTWPRVARASFWSCTRSSLIRFPQWTGSTRTPA